jgi:hypothetical protein
MAIRMVLESTHTLMGKNMMAAGKRIINME